MANFIDRLSEKLAEEKTRDELRRTLSKDALPHEESLQRLVKKHWHKLPQTKTTGLRPAVAVDGSRAVRHLANGAYLFVAQALIVGERMGEPLEDADVDVKILSGATQARFIERYAELMMHRLEAALASKYAETMPQGSVIFLDGALYGQLPQLYPLGEGTEAQENLPGIILEHYKNLFNQCSERNLILVSIAKTSHEATHSKVWWRHTYTENLPKEREISDSEALYRWTELAAGFSTPILFGKRSFSNQPENIVFDKVRNAPAIASFFVRLAEFDDALRIDVPATCLGRGETIGDIETDAEILLDAPDDVKRVTTLLELLQADYGGLEVYNALLYSVDREVRLRQVIMDEVYIPVIESGLREGDSNIELRLDRSERRFHSR